MLTTEAMEARAWLGLDGLRSILGAKRREFEDSFYPTSISVAQFDRYRPAALVAALVTQNRDTLLQSVTTVVDDEERQRRHFQLLDELHVLRGMLHSLASDLNSLAGEIQTVASAVSQTK